MGRHDDAGKWRELRRCAGGQRGLITRAQALSAGFAPSTVDALLQRGEWTRLGPGVYALPGATGSPHVRAAAAVLAAPGAALTGWTAAWLWDLVTAAPSTVEIILPHGRRGPSDPHIQVRRSRTLTDDDVTEHSGVRTVRPSRAIVDLAGRAELGALRALALDARQRGLLDVPGFVRVVERAGAVTGAEKLRSLVREISDGRADSVLEHRTRAKLRRHDLHPHPEPFPVVVGGRTLLLDIAFPRYRVALETEGLAYHSTPAQLAHDHERYNLLATTDWRILRIGWRDVEEDFGRIVRCLTELLAARGWRPGGEG